MNFFNAARPLRSVHRVLLGAALSSASLFSCTGAIAAEFQDPPALASQHGLLSVLMIAAKRPQVRLGSVTTDLWTYEICRLPSPGANACPHGTGQDGLGGVRLALQQGDTLRIRLVNDLPPLDPGQADHIADNPALAGNPTNLHTHGLIVEPHKSVGPADPYGDYVFVDILNTNNPIPPLPPHPGVDIARNAAEYLDTIDPTHPSGLFWYHPHLHGLSLNQVSAGLAGAITIGNPADVCADAECAAAINRGAIRHLVLKDTQVLTGGILHTQEEPAFCAGAPPGGRRGSCNGQFIDPSDPTTDYRGGKWLHTISGQVYPSIPVGPDGDMWRIVNASGSRSYTLSLNDQSSGKPLPMQLLSIDGVTLKVGPTADPDDLVAKLGHKMTLMPCPGQPRLARDGVVCVSTVNMMPSSRVELRVVRSDPGPGVQNAVLQTAEYTTGGGGDDWPQIDLAAVTLAPRSAAALPTVRLRDLSQPLFSSVGQLLGRPQLRIPGTMSMVMPGRDDDAVTRPATGHAIHDVTPAASVAVTPAQLVGQVSVPNCAVLAPGHHRKILFGYPTPTTFGLGYVEVDERGRDVESTRIPVTPFDPSKTMVCVPLQHGQATHEVWELQNITNEDHNFHIHQTRFFLVGGDVLPGTTIPQMLDGNVVMHDNVPVPRGNPGCGNGTLDAVKTGQCAPSRTFVVIPFREMGDFVFHCHILEHEDGGMMARIRVVATE